MIAEDLISREIPPLRTSDTGLKAVSWMEEFKIFHLPIVNHTDFLGLISEEDIYNLNTPEEPLGNHQLSLTRPYVRNHQHIYEVIKLVSGAGHDAVAVAPVAPVAMLFVRCFKGISHNPLENVELKDLAAAVQVSTAFIHSLIQKHNRG